MRELLLAGHTRRGFVDGIGFGCLPFASIRGDRTRPLRASFEHVARLAPLSSGIPGPSSHPRRSGGRPATDAVYARPQRHRGRADRGAAPSGRRAGCPADPPRAGRGDHAHRADLGPGPGGDAGGAWASPPRALSMRSSGCTSRMSWAALTRGHYKIGPDSAFTWGSRWSSLRFCAVTCPTTEVDHKTGASSQTPGSRPKPGAEGLRSGRFLRCQTLRS
jgi:hypothetical protein